MIIAIPEAQGKVNQHFGRSTSFAIIEINESRDIVSMKTISTEGLQHQHSGLASILKEQGAETVIVGGIGQGAIQGLEDRGMTVLYGATGAIKDVASSFAQDKFVSNKKVCNHHDH